MSPTSPTSDTSAEYDTEHVSDWNWDGDSRNSQNCLQRESSIASTIFSAAVSHILQDFNLSSASLSSFLISVHVTGFTIGPLLCPVSEVYGRSPLMHVPNVLFVLSSVICALSPNVGVLIAGRILTGMAGCVPAVLGGRYITDLMPVEQRGMALSIWGWPIAGDYFAEKAGWRLTFCLEAIVDGYGFSEGQVGLAYIGPWIGFLFGQCIFGLFIDRHFKKQALVHGSNIPETRLNILSPGNILIAAGLFWYGWSAEGHTHWVLPLAGTAVVNMGIFFVCIAIQSYLTGSFEEFAASTLAATTIVRSILGAVLPLSAPALYERLGQGRGNSLLGFTVLVFVPATVVFMRFGERMRLDARFHIQS
ncbi:uncharacterized protein KD926_005935 [Aspergillus affinis]|uniref:uncharacterized protein n=1 Tax=Aspergillus affinis TaxID=1070780 RepID=UPI0022FF35B1|nr:uncharacterized protein KD926_005935 [Aspergillus affinis]KAI9045990.1 hypothetical protein KD926_005935 [Aspergillus affinis]